MFNQQKLHMTETTYDWLCQKFEVKLLWTSLRNYDIWFQTYFNYQQIHWLMFVVSYVAKLPSEKKITWGIFDFLPPKEKIAG